MAIRIYLDEDSMNHALEAALRSHGVDVLTPLQAGMIQVRDDEKLNYAAAEGRAIYSFNVGDFYRLHGEFLAAGRPHAGIILSQQQQFSIGEQMRRLLKLIATLTEDEMVNRVEFLGAWG